MANWRPPDWNINKLVGMAMTRAVNNGFSWALLIELGADAMLEAMEREKQDTVKCASCGREVEKDDPYITFVESDMVICGYCAWGEENCKDGEDKA